MAIATIGMTVVGASGALLFSQRLERRIGRLRAFVEGLVSGASQAPHVDSGGELAELTEALTRVAPQVNDLVDKVRLEGARRDAILTGMVEGVLAVDREMRVTFCNTAFATVFGVQGPAPAGLPVLRLVRDPDFLEMLRTVASSGQSLKRRMHLTGADGAPSKFRPRPSLAPPAAAPWPSCMTLPIWSGWSASARTLWPTSRTNCGRR